jgi:predicted glycosyltransferase
VVLEAFRRVRPDVVVVELYPFGRRKFEFELRPLLDAAAGAPCRPLVLSSVRDILVGRDDGGRHDERAVQLANDRLHAVLVHSDPTFARLEDSFRPSTPLAVPVHHTGFVVPPRRSTRRRSHRRLLVSAGGGMVGAGLLSAAADAAVALHARTGLTTTLVAGPFLPDAARRHLWSRRSPVLEVVDRVDDLCGEVEASAASLSQAGYNTTLDVVRAGRPAVVVPYADGGEDEQTRRAARMAALGVLRVVPAAELTPVRLVDDVVAALAAPPPTIALDLGGRERTTEIVADLVAARRRQAVS